MGPGEPIYPQSRAIKVGFQDTKKAGNPSYAKFHQPNFRGMEYCEHQRKWCSILIFDCPHQLSEKGKQTLCCGDGTNRFLKTWDIV